MEDKTEFELFQDLLGVEKNANFISEFKSSHFVLSTCINSTERIQNEEMWKKYGDDNKGVIIEIEVNEDIKTKSDIFLGKINYTDDTIPNNIQKLTYRHTQFIKANARVNSDVLNRCLAIVSSFYKKKSEYGFEEEVRILKNIDKPQGDYHLSNEVEYFYDSLKNKVYCYTQLPIDGKLISIKKIYIHENIYYKLDIQFIKVILSRFKKRLKNNLEFEIIA